MNNTDEILLREIAEHPDDCWLNHKVSKAALKRLLAEGFIEAETRHHSTWHSGPDLTGMTNAQRYAVWEEWGKTRRSMKWKDRTEIHACLTEAGSVFVNGLKREHD